MNKITRKLIQLSVRMEQNTVEKPS